ncbi:hypothetical protein [Vibrio brasiliensis]|uniref:hypothetical protein n=1 Tax=Vibrio brasiliensis TaxID=170652 RepID=UPI001EFCAF6D|nr:hypothetical protein [Vibrio brasiliensis]MCG9727501.1 hypothetical protein [Vibrio brasiliensis]
MKKTILSLSVATALAGCQTTTPVKNTTSNAESSICSTRSEAFNYNYEDSDHELLKPLENYYDCSDNTYVYRMAYNATEDMSDDDYRFAALVVAEQNQADWCSLPEGTVVELEMFDYKGNYIQRLYHHPKTSCSEGYYTKKADAFQAKLESDDKLEKCLKMEKEWNEGQDKKAALYGYKYSALVSCDDKSLYTKHVIDHPRLESFKYNAFLKKNAKTMLIADDTISGNCENFKSSDSSKTFADTFGIAKLGSVVVHENSVVLENFVSLEDCK